MSRLTTPPRALSFIALAVLAALSGAVLACTRTTSPGSLARGAAQERASGAMTATLTPFLPPTGDPARPQMTPTPDLPRILPTPRTQTELYTVQPGDSLGPIARRYGVGVRDLVESNQLSNPDFLAVGQSLVIPPPRPQAPGPAFKIIPDSELVYGPMSARVDYVALVRARDGYLNYHSEVVDEVPTSGLEILTRVAREHSINPLLLVALLEYQSGWVTRRTPDAETLRQPILATAAEGLYHQLAWAANQLNYGYYLWKVSGVGTWVLPDGQVVPIDPTINAGTAAIQNLMAGLYNRPEWEQAVGVRGLFAAYSSLFGYPFDLAIEPLVPPGLEQPAMQLPFEPGRPWAFTSGPHGGWASGSGWAALDFAPPGEPRGCVVSNDWVVAVADGPIIRADNGAVVQDLDGDGLEQTGWTVLYLHIEGRDRVAAGAYLQAGERVGHPSCEGGFSTGTHLHIARRYNGEWIPADQSVPFVMDGWASGGYGVLYSGYLTREGTTVESCNCRADFNTIQR